MKILTIYEDYRKFLNWLYKVHSGLADESYENQMRIRKSTYFGGTSIFYTKCLESRGYTARTVYPNNETLEKMWRREQGNPRNRSDDGVEIHPFIKMAKSVASKVPVEFSKFITPRIDYRRLKSEWYYDTLEAQIREFKPDTIFNKNFAIDTRFYQDMEFDLEVLVSSVGLPEQKDEELSRNDGVIAHIPGVEEYIRDQGVPSTLIRHAFGKEVLDRLPESEPDIPVSFIGSLTPRHEGRIRFLETVCERVPVQVWAPSVEHLDQDSPIRDLYQGQAWGKDMYEILSRSKITLNRHIDGVDAAANVRLFEATGVGTMLLTDEKDRLSEIFEPGEEVVTYGSAKECASKVERYLDNEADLREIADTGQERTLTDHTYEQRSELLEAFLDRLR